MSEDIFKKFDKTVDLGGLSKDVEAAKENGGNRDYKDVPVGEYEVEINKMELTVTKSKPARPMFTCWMKILNGEYKGQLMFMYQVVEQGFQIHIVNEFLRSLLPADSSTSIEFTENGGYTGYADLIMDVFEEVSDTLEYAVKKYKTNKGYDGYEVKDIYDKE